MPGFDDNPFAEPTIDNPFADPAVQQVTNNSNIAQRGLDDYSPFGNQDNRNAAGDGQGQQNQPAIMRAVPLAPAPNYSRSAQQTPVANTGPPPPQNYSTADFQRRQEELERKAEALARMEEQLRQAGGAAAAGRRNNWPPLPSNCPMQPCFYQDINVDIPLDFQRVVRHMYYLWLFHALVMMLNIVGGFALLIHTTQFKTFGLAILYFILFTPFSFICWYRPVYKAFRSDSSFSFMVYFFVFFFQFIVTVIQAIGIEGSGTCGVLMAMGTFDGSGSGAAVGVFLLLIAAGFVTAATADILLIAKVHRIYRSTGASFAKAQQEFSSEIMGNQHLQSAAANAATAALNSQINASRY